MQGDFVFRRRFNKYVWNEFNTLTGHSPLMLLGLNAGVKMVIGDIMEGLHRFTYGGACLGLHWSAITTILWHLWNEKNR